MAGKYLFECWGAQGGTGNTNGVKKYEGGRGAYVSGILKINKQRMFYLYIGGKGADADESNRPAGGYNGGGNGGIDGDDDDSGAGGGSTDVRLVSGLWNNEKSIYSRIMVAAGGSGSVFNNYGAPGGTLTGYLLTKDASKSYTQSTTTQTSGYKLGVGDNGQDHSSTPSSGAGGGYYGGIAVSGLDSPEYLAVSSSGSSFVSGCSGCNAVNENGKNTGSSIHYSKLSFENIVMKAGSQSFPSISGSTETGHAGHGAIKITAISQLLDICSNDSRYRKNNVPLVQIIVLIYS